jgi:DNA-binding transcriptional regulator YiaG
MGIAKLTPELTAEIKAIRAEKGLTLKEIAAQYDLCEDTVSKALGGVQKSHIKITPELIEEMRTYRELGLSNSQIAIEMNLAVTTVRQYIGAQPKNTRAEYGSIVAHSTGDSYAAKKGHVKEKKMYENTMKSESALNLVSIITTFNGNSGIKYKLNGTNQVQIVTEKGENMTLESGYFLQFAQEIAELRKFIEVNQPKA